MKLFAISLLLLGSPAVLAAPEVVYGEDNRKDVFETSNALHLKLAKSTASMISRSFLTKAANGSYKLNFARPLGERLNLCSTESYADQTAAASCSGFLVGPDTLVTAGHCYVNISESPEEICKNFAWVFDYSLNSASENPAENISSKNVYSCKKVIKAQQDKFLDFTVIKLDRKVTEREPLKFRTSGKVSDSTSLVVIGNPSGIPTKIAPGGKVVYNKELTRFSTNLDTFQGNSGSAVFDSQSGLLEGILIMGKTDYVQSNPADMSSCLVVNRCQENGQNCTQEDGGISGEIVLRITTVSSAINQALAMP